VGHGDDSRATGNRIQRVVQKTIWRRLSNREANDAWDLAVATLILIESMKLHFSETTPDYYELKAANEERGELKSRQEKQKWG
jgi:hypothetical protein